MSTPMFAELFIQALLGHLIGDYLLQSKLMALRKSEKGMLGMLICTTHVLIYSCAVGMMIGVWSPTIFLLIAIPHWIIDRWSLGMEWLKFIKGRTFRGVLQIKDVFHDYDIAFTALVYTVVDNTFHLLSLWLLIKFVIL